MTTFFDVVYFIVWLAIWFFVTKKLLESTVAPITAFDIILCSIGGFLCGFIWFVWAVFVPFYLFGLFVKKVSS